MVQVQTTIQTKEEQLAALYEVMQANNDGENAEKILDLYEKLQNEELVISFSGHFSAGKSSMINTLLGKEILPKSPIPTSANIVKITSGEGWARVFFKDGNPVEYKEPYDLEMIKDYSTDRDTIKRIEISTKDAIVPKGSVIMDTPGIDAADDADRIMTESSLHLVDVLFYVMDYNHVQSEVNLYFLKSLQNNNIPFYLIINQIDKHNEAELSFASFKESIRRTFKDWEIYPENIFYTSLYDFSLPENEFTNVKHTLFRLLENEGKEFFNIDASVQQVIANHKQFLEEQYENLKNEIEIDEELEARLTDMGEKRLEIESLAKEPEELSDLFHKELNQTLQNAYLMPKELRDIAEEFLRSQEPGFKVGFIGAKKKTEEEKQKRIKQFHSALKKTMESTIQWKLRDKFNQILKDFAITDQSLIESVNNFSIDYSSEDFINLLKPGAKVNGDYVLNYTNDVANDIKAKYKRSALNLLETIKQNLEKKHASTVQQYEEFYKNIEKIQDIQVKFARIEEELSAKQKFVDELYESPVFNREHWEQAIIERQKKAAKIVQKEQPVMEKATLKIKEKQENIDSTKPISTTLTAEETVERIEKTIALTEKLPGFADLIQDLKLKKDRLANRTFTVALFGAFSAGKSSFSNALMGERVLPVSPNPTTATVNRIHPTTEQYPHGTVVVTMKKEEDLHRELVEMTKNFSPRGEDFPRLLRWIEKKNIVNHEHLNNMYQAYIQALINGYPMNKESIGKSITITFDEFASYVTDEKIACYIEAIDVYYDCPITEQGITLVDTPGADSVNARHTNVAFNYIKHADAILYVTYYNHALSRADRDFLMQLGRVKDAFQLDKMFFIVNAADLAENEEELKLVTSYVNDELIKLGIREAKLFPVSSKQSIEDKERNMPLNEKMKRFEDHFNTFIHQDLAQITIESALWDIKRISETMEHYISSINMDPVEKENKKQAVKQDQEKALSFISEFEAAVYEDQMKQRIEKQLYYVIERLGIRYHDMFKEMFNPTTITENGRKANAQLQQALNNLIEYVRYELNQELQAVSLRIEGYALELANEVYHAMQVNNKEINPLFSLPNQFTYEFETPAYEEKLTELNLADFKPILSKYRGTKAFFVQNEKEVMKEELYDVLLPAAERFIQLNQQRMISGYLKEWEQLIKEMKESTTNRLKQQVNNYFAMLETPTDIETLEQNLKQLEKLASEKVGLVY